MTGAVRLSKRNNQMIKKNCIHRCYQILKYLTAVKQKNILIIKKGGLTVENSKWYSLSEASRKIGRSRAYFSSIKTNHPEYFENVEVKKIGDNLVINQHGIEEVLKHVKKVGDRLRNLPLKAVYKAKEKSLLLLPRYKYSLNLCRNQQLFRYCRKTMRYCLGVFLY